MLENVGEAGGAFRQLAQAGVEASADGFAGDDAGDLALLVDFFARVFHAGDARRQFEFGAADFDFVKGEHAGVLRSSGLVDCAAFSTVAANHRAGGNQRTAPPP